MNQRFARSRWWRPRRRGTTAYTASGTTMSVRTRERRTGCHPIVSGEMAVMPMATRGKIASQVMIARTWIDGRAGTVGRAVGAVWKVFMAAVLTRELGIAIDAVPIHGSGIDAIAD